MTNLQCLRGPLDGALVESNVAMGKRINLSIAPRKATYPDWGGLSFMTWDIAKEQAAQYVAVYERVSEKHLLHVNTLELESAA